MPRPKATANAVKIDSRFSPLSEAQKDPKVKSLLDSLNTSGFRQANLTRICDGGVDEGVVIDVKVYVEHGTGPQGPYARAGFPILVVDSLGVEHQFIRTIEGNPSTLKAGSKVQFIAAEFTPDGSDESVKFYRVVQKA